MEDAARLICELTQDVYLQNIKNGLEYYRNELFNIEKVYENEKLVGFFVWIELEGVVYLEEAYYNGKNKFQFLRIWKKVFKKNKNYRTKVFKVNKKMIDFYNKIGFKVIKEDFNYYYFEYIKG